MTTLGKPLTYDSRKAVFQHIDVHTRTQLSHRCPSLRTLDSMFTIKIRNLHLQKSSFRIDSNTYTVGIIKRYINILTPYFVLIPNRGDGVPYDVDQYGTKLNPTELERDENMVNMLQRQLNWRQHKAARKSSENSENQRKIRRIEEELRIYQLKRDGLPPPFNLYFQIMITPKEGTRRFEYVVYDRPLKQALDHILLKTLGTERQIQIQNLRIGHYCDFLIRRALPTPYFPFNSQRMYVQNLLINSTAENALDIVRPVLTNTLKTFQVGNQIGMRNGFEDPIVCGAKLLKITGKAQLAVLSNANNQRVHLERCQYTDEEFNNLATNWRRYQNKIGMFYSIGFQWQGDAENLANKFKSLPNAYCGENEETRCPGPRLAECAVLQLSDTSELNVWFEKTGGADIEYCAEPYIVKLKVVRKGYANEY